MATGYFISKYNFFKPAGRVESYDRQCRHG
jgi:hypothetical protein